MIYVLIFICAASIIVNMILASYCQRLAHWANFWKQELKREQMGVRPIEVKQNPFYVQYYADGGEDDCHVADITSM